MTRNQTKSQVRNLYQYKNLSDEDFERLWQERESGLTSSTGFESRIQKKIEDFSRDYDLDDLKINDMETLRALIRALLTLEDYENFLYLIRTEEAVGQANINVIDRLSKMTADLRKGISDLQEDLNITRRNRKSDKESSVISYLDDLKEKARRFYESRVSYVFCPKCNMLLGTVWCLYPEEPNNFEFTCHRKNDDGTFCNEHVRVTSKELLENKGTSSPDITPEGLL